MLNLKLADAYVDLSLQRGKFDADLAGVLRQLQLLPTTIPITVLIQANAAAAHANINLVQQHMQALHGSATIPVRANATGAHASLNLLLQQLATVRAQANIPVNVRRTGGLGGLFGGRGGGAGGFGTGVMQGLGMPYAANPQMMAGQMVARASVATIQTAAHLETEFAQLQRITGLTTAQMDKFKATLFEMGQTRPGVSIQDLAEMSQIGGRMGVVDKSGPEGLKSFVDQLARVKLAVTDIGTEELANQVGRVLNVFDYGTEYVAGFGSALVAMDNVSTASAKDILNITQRLSGTAKAIGLTLPQVTALSSVLKDVGLPNEVAGSAFSQIFRMIEADSGKFAEKIGVDAKAFGDALRRDPMDGLRMIIDKFKEMKDTLEGQEFIKDLGFKGVRTAGALQQLSSKFEEVGRRTRMAAGETGTQASLGAAGKIMGSTAETSFQRAGNGITDLANSVGSRLLPVAKAAAYGLGEVTSSLASIVKASNQVSFAGGPNAPPGATPGALAEKNPTPFIPKTLEEANADVTAARKKATEAEAAAVAKNKEADRLGFEGREAMRGAAGGGPGAFDAASAQMQRAETAQEAAARAAESANQAADDLKGALQRQKEAQQGEDKKQAGYKSEDTIAGLKQKALGIYGAFTDAKQSVLGIGAKALIKTANAAMPDEEQQQQHYSVGTNMMDAGRRIQEQILNSKGDKDRNAETTAKNTGEAVSLLAQAVEALKRGANQTVGAALNKP